MDGRLKIVGRYGIGYLAMIRVAGTNLGHHYLLAVDISRFHDLMIGPQNVILNWRFQNSMTLSGKSGSKRKTHAVDPT